MEITTLYDILKIDKLVQTDLIKYRDLIILIYLTVI